MTGRRKAPKRIKLALQGGGGHGAFTWGVLDALIEDGRIGFDAISATSGGAMNAAVMLDALDRGGPDEARASLERFWQQVSEHAAMLASSDKLARLVRRRFRDNALNPVDLFHLLTSPQDIAEEPARATNPLQGILEGIVDFDRLRSGHGCDLHVAATNVATGKVRVFSRRDVTPDVIMASGCLPYLFQAIEIDGETYWDGGYSSNPSLWPFFDQRGSKDILVVRLFPLSRDHVPKTAEHILQRTIEIAFDNSLIQELRAIAFVDRLVEKKHIGTKAYEAHRLHRIDPEAAMVDHESADWVDNSWDYFLQLRDAGRTSAQAWLREHYDAIGHRGTAGVVASRHAARRSRSTVGTKPPDLDDR